ncbi:MAG: hypothetical protein DRI94_11850 [Bacteroidetes bacterium]|nr:MAG: hypothetical protein DRI94_11850 [Bacteroidota bacterium]
MKSLQIIILFFCFAGVLNAQTNEIKNIREQYTQIQKEIAAQKNDDMPKNNMHIIVNQNMPGIGEQQIEYHFYFELEDIQDQVPEHHNMFFATRQYNVAASSDTYEEFLYDLSGNLLFYFQKTSEEKCKQLRCYFKDNKLIKVIYKEADLIDDTCPSSSKYKVLIQSKNKLPQDFGMEYLRSTSKSIMSIFKALDK